MSWTWLATLPTTNARVAVTLLLALGTGVKVIVAPAWVPPTEWLLFLLAMAGVDVVQFTAKRLTHQPGVGREDAPVS